MEKEYKYMVCTQCWTFNHAPYIVDAMNGFTMQETTFPVVTVIVDDASTDGEPNVIREYLNEHFQEPFRTEDTDYAHIICANHKTNPNCQFVVLFLKFNHYSIKKPKQPYLAEWLDNAKYHALCEGDDYWTDQDKLKKQVSFLETHPEYNVCSHDYVVYYEKKKQFANISAYSNLFQKYTIDLSYFEYSLDVYFKGWFFQPLTCIYRNGVYISNIPREKYKYYRDDIFFYYILKQGKGVLLRNMMGVYRIHDGGSWSSKTKIDKCESTIYNAYNIFIVEKDKNAIYLIKLKSVELIKLQLQEKKFTQCYNSIKKIYQMLPLKDFLYVLFNSSKILIILIKKTCHI